MSKRKVFVTGGGGGGCSTDLVNSTDHLESNLYDLQRQKRHADAAHASDVAELRQALRDAALRFSDIADMLDEKGQCDHTGFMRVSAKRYKMIADKN